MSDLQSNYPRHLGQPVGLDDVASLRRSALIGQVSLIVLFAMTSFMVIFPHFVEFDSKSDDLPLLPTVSVLLVLVSAISSMWATMFWVTRAHRAVCSLRGITSRISSKLLGFASGIPYLLFFAPLSYALDFLVIRSASPDAPTMRWYSWVSKSTIVTVFAVSMIVDTGIVLYEIIHPSNETRIEPLDIVATITFLIGTVSGIRIAKTVNQKIEALIA